MGSQLARGARGPTRADFAYGFSNHIDSSVIPRFCT